VKSICGSSDNPFFCQYGLFVITPFEKCPGHEILAKSGQRSLMADFRTGSDEVGCGAQLLFQGSAMVSRKQVTVAACGMQGHSFPWLRSQKRWNNWKTNKKKKSASCPSHKAVPTDGGLGGIGDSGSEDLRYASPRCFEDPGRWRESGPWQNRPYHFGCKR